MTSGLFGQVPFSWIQSFRFMHSSYCVLDLPRRIVRLTRSVCLLSESDEFNWRTARFPNSLSLTKNVSQTNN